MGGGWKFDWSIWPFSYASVPRPIIGVKFTIVFWSARHLFAMLYSEVMINQSQKITFSINIQVCNIDIY